MFLRLTASSVLIVFTASTLCGKGSASSPSIPFVFVENRGQANAQIRYTGTGPEFKAWFEDRGVILQQSQTTVSITFEGASIPRLTPRNPTGARANYLHGGDPRHWQTDLPLFSALEYTGVWPGVELTYKAEGSRVKAEYVVAPGADPGSIQLRFYGEIRIQADGTLRVRGASGDFIEEKPVLYQDIGGRRAAVAGGFKEYTTGAIGYWVGEYDRSQPLVVDPSILFSGYFGGTSQESITAVGIDGANNIVVAGWTASTDLPSAAGARRRTGGGVDAFVASFLPNGGALIYCTYLGGSGDDRAFGLAIDSARSVYLTGQTSSANFPVLGAIQSRLTGTRDAFITKLNAAGNALVYSTYLGGSGATAGTAIGLDASNSAIIIGDSTSSDLPVSSSAFQKRIGGSQDVFAAKVSPQGNALTFMTYLGGTGLDHGSAVNVGAAGGFFIGGYTWSTNFPTSQAFQPKSGGGQDGFIAKMSADGGSLLYGSYLGGTGGSVGAPEEVNAIYRDQAGYVVVAGTTSSPNFPVTSGALQTTFGGVTDGFVARFSPSWKLSQCTFVGGSLSDGITAMAHDFHGIPYVTGFTESQDFPVQGVQNSNAGALDAFVVKLNSTLSAATFGTYLGGSGSDRGNAIAVDFETSIVVAGQTSSNDFPASGNLQNSPSELLSSFVTKIAPPFTAGVSYGYQGQQIIATDPWRVASFVQSGAFGNATDLPIAADWDGSGKKRVGIFRNGTWILDINGDGILSASDKTVLFGQAGDVPVAGDWSGTGHISLGLFRRGTFILDLSGHLSGVPTGRADAVFTFGQGGDIPIIADWNASGASKVGVFRNGLWLVDFNGDQIFNSLDRSYVYGQAGDIPVVGDWDSSGFAGKIGVYRSGLWVLDYDGDNALTTPYLNEMVIGFGLAGYTPLVF